MRRSIQLLLLLAWPAAAQVPDAGIDAGAAGRDAGSSTAIGPTIFYRGESGNPEPQACGCSAGGLLLPVVTLGWLLRRRRISAGSRRG